MNLVAHVIDLCFVLRRVDDVRIDLCFKVIKFLVEVTLDIVAVAHHLDDGAISILQMSHITLEVFELAGQFVDAMLEKGFPP